ncbi:hypothetical protein BSKO_01521 [Bryopsis sp. KO-2023]|nr:hypothetical protein BSKO_01521 [Bryopsis sp. KO-2023]
MSIENCRPPLMDVQAPDSPSQGVSSMDYERLKKEVKNLRTEKKEVLRVRQAKKEVAAQNAIAMREDWEARLAVQEATINKLKAHLNDTNQRSSKMRTHYERRDKAATIKYEKSCRSLEDERLKHRNEIEELKKGFETKLIFERKNREEQLEERDKAMDALRERVELEKEVVVQEIVKECEEKVSAMKDKCLEATSRLNEVENNWRMSYDALKLKREAALETIHDKDTHVNLLEATIQQLRKEIDLLEDRREKDKAEIKAAKEDLEKEQLSNQAEVCSLREQQEKQMEMVREQRSKELQTIQSQIESVLSSKNEAIQQLTRKLKESNSAAKALEAKMEQWKTQLKEC